MRTAAPPLFVEPMLLTTCGDTPPAGGQWWAELKLDGCRGQLRVTGGHVQLRTRPGRRCEQEFPEITTAATALPDLVLDGEITVPAADGTPDFPALRRRLGATARTPPARPACFWAFDLLWLDGHDLRARPLHERRALLDAVPLDGQRLRHVTGHPGRVQDVLQFARDHHLEGVVLKRADSPYRSGRSQAWRKLKLRRPETVWVTAWTPGRPRELDRYWVSRPTPGRGLVPVGEVSFGLTPADAAAVRRALQAAERGPRRRGALRPVRPVVRMTVEAHGRVDGPLRDPVIRTARLEPAGPAAA